MFAMVYPMNLNHLTSAGGRARDSERAPRSVDGARSNNHTLKAGWRKLNVEPDRRALSRHHDQTSDCRAESQGSLRLPTISGGTGVSPEMEPTISGGTGVSPEMVPTISGGTGVSPEMVPTISGGTGASPASANDKRGLGGELPPKLRLPGL